MKSFSLSGKTILITGASSGIGKEAAVRLSLCGANVVITGRNEGRLNETFQNLQAGANQIIKSDLTDPDQIESLTDKLRELNGVVHCAGITSHMPAKFLRQQDIDEIFNINYNVPVLLTSSILKKKKILNNSSIVFLSSIATKYPYYGGALYTSSKAALEAYSRVLALELASKKIRSNCLSPSFVKTPMVDGAEKTISKDVLDKFEKMMPLGFGEAEDVANAIVFFLSDESKWITGTNLVMGGG
jgi:predicted outer membrane repeat protein